MLSPRVQRTISEATYAFFVLIIAVASILTCAALISQAVRTSPSKSWTKNFNALIIGAAYIILFALSILYCVKRRIAVRLKLQRIAKPSTYATVNRDELPASVHRYITQEYIRTCLVVAESLPKDVNHEGWGQPGSAYNGVRFRRSLLDTIPRIDDLAHVIIPRHPRLKPHARMLHHFRFLAPLLPKDEDGMSPLHFYDAAIQLARNSAQPLSEEEYEIGMGAAQQIEQCLRDLCAEMSETESTTVIDP